MRTPILTATLALAVLALGACSSDDDPATGSTEVPASGAATTASTAEAAPAVVADPATGGTTTYCTNVARGSGDYVWTGTQFTAKSDATLDHAGPASLGGVRVVGSWIVEDERDDGFFGRWDDADAPGSDLERVRTAGASLRAGTTYRLVLRLRPSATGSGQVGGFDVAWTADDTQGSLTDDSVLQFARHCG
ncbi:MAG: hypothetical protein JWO76_1452 [Nocardioides sp.]|nr:hypothetical protein [Nocardioides sp.]